MKQSRTILGLALWLCSSLAVLANAPPTSPRPAPRPLPEGSQLAQPGRSAGLETVIQNILRPSPRPHSVQNLAAAGRGPVLATAVATSPRPTLRPANFARLVAAARSPAPEPGRRGSVCGVRQIRGQALAAIPAKLPGCGVSQPVRVSEVSGVRLSQAAVMDCDTAKALNSWVRRGVKPAVGNRGGGLAALKVIAHYSCRTRNNRPGARISEHGKGRAVDIAGVILKNGDLISVLRGWRDRSNSRIVRAMHRSACGTFGTVLGPDADRYHQDHIHVDTARYRSGPYCR